MVDPEAQEQADAEQELDDPLAHASSGVSELEQLVAAASPERRAAAQQILREVNERLDRIREVLLPAPASVAEVEPSPPGGRVLVIDDDPLVARSIQRMLAHQHEVTIVLDARDALARLETGERFDVILCDVIMPEVGGPEFHAELVRRLPEQARRLVFVTGGAFSPDVARYLDASGVRKLEKPFDAELLGELVAEYC